MADIVNLRTHRKRAARRDAELRAAENRALHGQSKAERTLTQARAAKQRHLLDQHHLQEGERE